MAVSMHTPRRACLGFANCKALPCVLRPRFARRGCTKICAESPIIEEVAGRRINAPVFNRTRWQYHQNTGRYARHLSSIFRSITFRNLQGPLSALTLVSCLVVLYRSLVEMGELPDFFELLSRENFPDVNFPWCAAMNAWGSLRNSSAHLIRKAAAWVDDTASLQRLARWVDAFPLCLMLELRHDQGDPALEAAIRAQLREVLRPHEVEQLVSAGPYYHHFCLSVLTALVEAAQLGESREATILDDLHGFNEAACECEKILRFPIPLTYTRHTSRFMLIYLTALPLALYDSCDWAVVPVTLVIAFLLLGIEDIGVQIEEPFSILPLPDICADLRVMAQRAIAQRTMVRCLADPDTCQFEPEELEFNMVRARAALGRSNKETLAVVGGANVNYVAGNRNGNGNGAAEGAGNVDTGAGASIDDAEADSGLNLDGSGTSSLVATLAEVSCGSGVGAGPAGLDGGHVSQQLGDHHQR
ncbi:hypothetical protein VOLCADRAFT_106175 [Volvox carteri f. nagariensis]|uniref:Uncharacterized protein n=1 Tax=Volvox carteri f. nagariensis TaxID=3068 RepID=D8U5K7_VOLCA|nr:uncharacterized protein VOLCADRAFT_106175 [Volvox carteri f. nagariensis]EFJ44936.1 hypothetical protein VOLCADRAFT_106175 [Volvox carteri f. nagariensis]|eukprot:XP_002953907.1 hypothetical protein VOLCADRAFT_106175 [Volvox carteri f. nagariensis]